MSALLLAPGLFRLQQMTEQRGSLDDQRLHPGSLGFGAMEQLTFKAEPLLD
jgi:hypothetical protein